MTASVSSRGAAILLVGDTVVLISCIEVGISVKRDVGATVGVSLSEMVGKKEGGKVVGLTVGVAVGLLVVGCNVGNPVGRIVSSGIVLNSMKSPNTVSPFFTPDNLILSPGPPKGKLSLEVNSKN